MPRLSVWFVRAALIYLATGFTFGALLLANKGVPFMPALWILLPIHMEFLLVGWLIQFAMGVAFWILPRYSRGAPRGNERLLWCAFVLFNTGVLLAAAVVFIPGLSLAGRGLEVLAVLFFVLGLWGRVKPAGA